MKVYEIEKELSRVLHEIEESGEVTPESLAKMELLETAYSDKMGGIAAHVLNLGIEADALKLEAKKLAARSKACENKIAGYESFLKIICAEGGTFGNRKIKWRKCPESVDLLVSDDDVPDQYKKQKIAYTVDKASIKIDLQSGVELLFAELKRNVNLIVE